MNLSYTKYFIAFYLIFLSVQNLNAQIVIDTIPLPGTYSTYDLQYRNTLKVDQNNNVWIGFKRIGAGKFDGNSWTMYDSTNSALPVNNVTAFYFVNGVSWIGTTAGIVNYDGTSWTLFNRLNSGLNADTIHCIEWNNGIIYVGTNQGLFSFNGSVWNRYYSGNSGLLHDTINAMTVSIGDSIWLGTNSGLYLLSNGIITNIGLEAANSYYSNITKLITDDANTVWITIGTWSNFNTAFFINGTLRRTNELFFSDCTGYPQNPYIICKSGDGGVWSYENRKIGSLYLPAFKINANIPKYERYDNPYTGINGISGVFSYYKYADTDSSNNFWTIRSNGGVNNNYLTRIQFEGLVSPDTSDLNCVQLDINQVRTRIWPDGNSHWDRIGNAAYEVPKGSGKNALFCNGLWIGGKDPSNNLHLAASTYRQSGLDFWPGPLDTTNALVDSTTSASFNKIWKVNRNTIVEFVQEFMLGNVGNGSYLIPNEILSWPGNGTGNFSRKMAPYIDFNQDGIYNPFDGDRPDIKGDQFLWWVFNDNLKPHTETGGANLGIEIHASAYAWNCQGLSGIDTIINYTTFYEYDIINRSNTDYHDVHLGVYSDVDLGNYLDDFIGSSAQNGFVYVYNGDSIDEGSLGYGANPPMLDYVVLKGPQAVPFDGIDNNHNGIIDEPGENTSINSFMYFVNSFQTGVGNPVNAPNFYTYMKSEWKDSLHLTYGSYGRTDTIPVDFMYTGVPYDTGWTEMNVGNEPGDRRWIAGSGPFALSSHSNRTLDFAYVFSRYSSAPNSLTTSIAQNNIDVTAIQGMWNSQIFPCSNGVIGIEELSSVYNLEIFPNPAHDHLIIRSSINFAAETQWEIFDPTGRLALKGEFKGPGEKKIAIQTLTKGMYFMRCKDKSKTYRGKFIRN